MAALCIGGVCIPYTALVPAVFLFLRWVAAQIGLSTAKEGDSSSSCCGSTSALGDDGAGRRSLKPRRSKLGKSLSTISTASSCSKTDGIVQNIDSIEQWQNRVNSAAGGPRRVVVKGTASWCRPCKEIDPFYQSLAKKYDATFTRIDVDDLDDVAADLSIAMMPTFVVLDRDGKELGRVSGANEGKLEALIQEHCAERVRS
jgi:thioredoxin 1